MVRVHAASVNMADSDYMRGLPYVATHGYRSAQANEPGSGIGCCRAGRGGRQEVTQFQAGDEIMGGHMGAVVLNMQEASGEGRMGVRSRLFRRRGSNGKKTGGAGGASL
jgi:hypothetical protein